MVVYVLVVKLIVFNRNDKFSEGMKSLLEFSDGS